MVLSLVATVSAFSMSVTPRIWKNGESVELFLKRNSIPLEVYTKLSEPQKKILTSIKPNAKGFIVFDDDKKIVQAIMQINESLQMHIQKVDENYELNIMPTTFQIQKKQLAIKVNNGVEYDIFKASQNRALTKELSLAFSKINIKKDIKNGDAIAVNYVQKVRTGKPSGNVKVVGAMVKTKHNEYYSFLNEKDHKYYDQFGNPQKEEFVFTGTPVYNARISSGFSSKRYHPILHRVRPHYGVDYSGSTNTKIYSVADGVVSFSGDKRDGYGRIITIRHKYGFESLYAHLNGYAVKGGARVKKGDLVGYMGNTGLSTGTHLHFGLYKYNQPINPMTEMRKFKDEAMDIGEKNRFIANISPIKNKMVADITKIAPKTTQVASNQKQPKDKKL
jgi:murein DD-endopeptidase MepM/ murein hydrolase activator NlpD